MIEILLHLVVVVSPQGESADDGFSTVSSVTSSGGESREKTLRSHPRHYRKLGTKSSYKNLQVDEMSDISCRPSKVTV